MILVDVVHDGINIKGIHKLRQIDTLADGREKDSNTSEVRTIAFRLSEPSEDFSTPRQMYFSPMKDLEDNGFRIVRIFPISDRALTLFHDIQAADLGLTSSGSIFDVFLRMLYLSAVTISTSGYGDIVPISNIARLVVALESVAGILIAGLFLNSIARQLSQRPPDL